MAGDDEPGKDTETSDAGILEVDQPELPALARPATLAQGLRFLQQRVPHFTQLSQDEERAMGNVGHLEPEFLAAGIHAAGVWPESKGLIGFTAEELRSRLDATAEWAEVRRELKALDQGIAGAILSEKHKIGTAILKLYRFLRTLIKDPHYQHLRPYYEDMRRAYGRRPRKPRQTAKPEPGKPEE